MGDLAGAAHAAVEAGAHTVVLCGRDEELRSRLGAIEGVDAWGFTDRMGDLLGAADVLIHSTAGLTVLEAQVRGTRVISYGWGAGHIRVNNHAFAQLDMADVARTPAELRTAAAPRLAASPTPRTAPTSGLPPCGRRGAAPCRLRGQTPQPGLGDRPRVRVS